MTTYKNLVDAEKALNAARKANPKADLMIRCNMWAKGNKYSIMERPDHLKEPSEFDGLTLSEFLSGCKVSQR